MLKFLKGKIQRRYLMDIWGKYRLKVDRGNIDNTVRYFWRVRKLFREMWKFRNKRYVYQLRIFYKFNPPRRLDPEFVKAKLLGFYYFNLSVHKLKKLFNRSYRVMNTPIHFLIKKLEGRLLYLLYRMGYETNLFIIEERLACEKPIIINKKECWNANYSIELGDWCYFKPSVRKKYRYFFLMQLEEGRVMQWLPRNFMFNLFYFVFFMYKKYRSNDFFFINKVDFLKINEMGNFLR